MRSPRPHTLDEEQETTVREPGEPTEVSGPPGAMPKGPPPVPPPAPPIRRAKPASKVPAPAIEVVSMKAQVAQAAEAAQATTQQQEAARRKAAAVKLRSLSELSGRHPTAPGALGYLAPRRAATEARPTRRRLPMLWIVAALAVAGAVAGLMWWLAHRR
jgi:hypothetical protein